MLDMLSLSPRSPLSQSNLNQPTNNISYFPATDFVLANPAAVLYFRPCLGCHHQPIRTWADHLHTEIQAPKL